METLRTYGEEEGTVLGELAFRNWDSCAGTAGWEMGEVSVSGETGGMKEGRGQGSAG